MKATIRLITINLLIVLFSIITSNAQTMVKPETMQSSDMHEKMITDTAKTKHHSKMKQGTSMMKDQKIKSDGNMMNDKKMKGDGNMMNDKKMKSDGNMMNEKKMKNDAGMMNDSKMKEDKSLVEKDGIKVIELVQHPGSFDKSKLNISPGKYKFKITNGDVNKEVAFFLHKKGSTAPLPNSLLNGHLKKGETKSTGILELTAGTYEYSCPLNPTPEYSLIVK